MSNWLLVCHTTFSENLQGVRVKKTIRGFATQSDARNAMAENFSAYVRSNVKTLELATIDADEAVVAYGGGAVEHFFVIGTGGELREMRRLKDRRGVVHYGNPADGYRTLCALDAFDIDQSLFNPPEREPWDETSERVTCRDCAKVVCAIRNEPYNTLVADIDDATLDKGIYEAVKPDGKVENEEVRK